MADQVVLYEHENERGEMEQWPGRPCGCGRCKGERPPLMPGDPDRHDMAAGDRATYLVLKREARSDD